jgi:hypothetical protein
MQDITSIIKSKLNWEEAKIMTTIEFLYKGKVWRICKGRGGEHLSVPFSTHLGSLILTPTWLGLH